MVIVEDLRMLEQLHCQPIQADYERIDETKLKHYAKEVPAWDSVLIDSIPHLQKIFEFSNEHEVMMFIQQLLALADKEDHHPEIMCQADQVKVLWWTQDIADLHLNDFIMAVKTDNTYAKIREYSYLQ